ncbi:MAG: hypothetical protein WCT42_04150 [Candidatus Paceibacterota bacterium]|jgi:L-asparagine transporter-like permease
MKKIDVIISLFAIVLCVGSFIDDTKKMLKNITIKTLIIGEAVAIIVLMYSVLSIMGHNTSTAIVVIGVVTIIAMMMMISLLIKKPKSDWQRDWFFGTH